MKYLDLPALHELDLALNFDTDDTYVIGGCDVYTVKAAGDDKKLYKRIEHTLEARHQSLQAVIQGMTPETKARFANELNEERMTPFGSFHNPSNRHKFAYLIATLNATHVDYDYANTLNTEEFVRINKEDFTGKINHTMYYLRPCLYSGGLLAGAVTPNGRPIWNPRHWQQLDGEISLNDCEIYAWEPSEDPFTAEGAGSAIWSFHFLMYNKERKRVCYFYLRGISGLSSSPVFATSLMTRFKQAQEEESPEYDEGSRKRAHFWLGSHRAKSALREYGASTELDDLVIDHDEVVDAEEVIGVRDRQMSFDMECESDDDSDIDWLRQCEKKAVRDISDHVTKTMEL